MFPGNPSSLELMLSLEGLSRQISPGSVVPVSSQKKSEKECSKRVLNPESPRLRLRRLPPRPSGTPLILTFQLLFIDLTQIREVINV